MSNLYQQDPDICSLIRKEHQRQTECLELIASENFTSQAVMDVLGSCLTNKYSEGLPGKRYYGGNQFIDQIETICQNRALQLFQLDPSQWGVNVQSYSGSVANFQILTALLQPHDRIMGLDLPSGGHLTHGYYNDKKKISAPAIYFESLPYQLNSETGLVDYDQLERQARLFKPKLIICGGSACPRDWDYQRLRQIADQRQAYLLCDMSHYGGLVAGQSLPSPFPYVDVVMTTTHKTLRGPRGALIFYRKQYAAQINQAVFPGCQGGPHENTIGAIAVALGEALQPQFRQYTQQVIRNAQVLAQALIQRGCQLVTGGTDTHLVLWDLKSFGITGSKMEKLYDVINITTNKNMIYNDKSAVAPYGIRLGTAALTTRGAKESDFVQIAEFLIRGLEIGRRIQREAASYKLTDFLVQLEQDQEIISLKQEVMAFARRLMPPASG